MLLAGLALIAVWQLDFFDRAADLDGRYRLMESTGINDEERFLYFLYYLGLYPVVSDGGHALKLGDPGYRKFSHQAAERVVAEQGATLSMESGHTIRAGDMGRTLLYLPYAIWKGTARDPRLAPTQAAAFTLALGALWTAFWWIRDPLLGAVAVALLGSNPFQLYEVHFHENVFGWPITTGILSLALSLPLLMRRPPPIAWVLALSVGVVLGTIREIRPEPVTILASVAASCLLASRWSWQRRAALAAAVVGVLAATSAGWAAYFDHKFEATRQVVAEAGGSVYQGQRDRHHMFWHPLWCGLGDFGQKHGYAWSDTTAKYFALPIVQQRYRELGGELDVMNLFWDPVYKEVLRQKIISDVTHDPLWYASVLAQRTARVLTWTTPLRVAAGAWRTDLPWAGLAALPVFALLAGTRSWPLLKLALFPLGTSLPAVLVFSGTIPGQTYTGWFHLIAAAVLITAALDAGRELARQAARRRQSLLRRHSEDIR